MIVRWLRALFHRHSYAIDWRYDGRRPRGERRHLFLKCTECEWKSDGVAIE